MASLQIMEHPRGCKCQPCRAMKTQILMADLDRYNLKTLAQVIAEVEAFTDEQKSLAWSPQPPFESMGAGDCRLGGSVGFDFNHESRAAKWRQARYRFRREEREAGR